MEFAVVALVAAGVAGVAGVAWWRAVRIRTLTALTLVHRRLGSDGIVIGGEGFVLERYSAPAVLLLHGAGDTPQTLRYLAEGLYAQGFHVAAPLLPGHGRTVADFARITADDLTQAARSAYDALQHTHDWVGVIGLSMGGALAVQIAADNESLPALGLIAPYLAMPPHVERAARLSRLWGPLVPVLSGGDGISVMDPVERSRGLAYGVFTVAALRALRDTMRRAIADLPRVAAPTLMIQSREDNRIAAGDAERAFAMLGARTKELRWVTGAAHIITVDYGREEVIAQQVAWMRRHLVPVHPGDRQA